MQKDSPIAFCATDNPHVCMRTSTHKYHTHTRARTYSRDFCCFIWCIGSDWFTSWKQEAVDLPHTHRAILCSVCTQKCKSKHLSSAACLSAQVSGAPPPSALLISATSRYSYVCMSLLLLFQYHTHNRYTHQIHLYDLLSLCFAEKICHCPVGLFFFLEGCWMLTNPSIEGVHEYMRGGTSMFHSWILGLHIYLTTLLNVGDVLLPPVCLPACLSPCGLYHYHQSLLLNLHVHVCDTAGSCLPEAQIGAEQTPQPSPTLGHI